MSRRSIPRVGPPGRVRAPGFARTQLSNGLTVVAVPKHELPVVDVQLVVPAGAVRNRRADAGLASMTAEMLDEGTKVRTAIELSEAIDLLGADLDIRVTWDATLAGLHVLSPRLEEGLRLLAELILEPTFPDQELERKREERLNALRQERDEPRAVAARTLARAVFGEHPFGTPIHGLEDSVRRIGRNDIEGDYRRFFSAERAFLVAAGDLKVDELFRLIEQLFGSWSIAAQCVETPAVPAPQKRRIVLVDKPGAPQSEVRFGHMGPPRNTAMYFPLIVANTVLGGSFKSRLNMRLREEKGYTYGASSSFGFRKYGGAFSGGAAVFTDVTDDTVRIILDELTRMAEQGATEEEVERARQYLAYGFARNLETTSDLVGMLSDVLLYELSDDYLDRYSENVLSVNVDDVRAAAAAWFDPEHVAISVVGDRARIEAPLARMGMPLEVWEVE